MDAVGDAVGDAVADDDDDEDEDADADAEPTISLSTLLKTFFLNQVNVDQALRYANTVDSTEYTRTQNLNWNEMFYRLISYKQQQHNNSTSVPKNYAVTPELGSWVKAQRNINMPISDHRVNLLNSIGFVWNSKLDFFLHGTEKKWIIR